MIPIVGIVMLFVWAFGGSAPKSKSNWAKAQLIVVAVIIVLSVVFYASIIAAIVNSLS